MPLIARRLSFVLFWRENVFVRGFQGILEGFIRHPSQFKRRPPLKSPFIGNGVNGGLVHRTKHGLVHLRQFQIGGVACLVERGKNSLFYHLKCRPVEMGMCFRVGEGKGKGVEFMCGHA